MDKARLEQIEAMANYGRDVASTPVEMAFRVVVPELIVAVRAARDERDALAATLEAARGIVREFEWDDLGYCPRCGWSNDIGHKPDCALAAVLYG